MKIHQRRLFTILMNHPFSPHPTCRKKDTVPAPSSYDMPGLIGPRIPNKPAAAAHSFAVRPNIGGYSEDLARTPGPGNYTPIDPNVIKTKKPKYSFGSRTTLPGDTTVKPGPG